MVGAEGLTGSVAIATEIEFNIDEFKQALTGNQEISVYDALVSSNHQANQTIKMPTEALFLDWQDGAAYRYHSATMEHLGVESKPAQDTNAKGVLQLADCNLAHRMLIKGFSINQTVKYLLDKFTVQNCFGKEKNLPENFLILNRNADFNKGVSKVLKMIVMMPGH